MFGHFRKLFTNPSLRKLAITSAITLSAISFSRTKVYSLSQQNENSNKNQDLELRMRQLARQNRHLKVIKQKQVCKSSDITEGKTYIVTVNDFQGKQHNILIVRFKNKLYAVKGNCPYEQPLGQTTDQNTSFKDAICFNDKLYCPHHGCAFDIQTGSVQYGPARDNLPRFHVQQKDGTVKVFYPQQLPRKIRPRMNTKNDDDLRKVVILGGDDAAVIGSIDAFRQYGYTGNIDIVQEQTDYLYRKQYLHKTIPNFRKDLALKPQNQILTDSSKTQIRSLDKQMGQLLQEKVYKKLRYQTQRWYKQYGINFIYTNDSYRMIGKVKIQYFIVFQRFYPYLSFHGGIKIEYDGLLVATGSAPLYPRISGFQTAGQDKPANVFMPYKNISEHQRLVKFLNYQNIKNLMVMGYNVESLEFIEAVNKSFPQIKIKVIDANDVSKITEQYGPIVQEQLAKEFSKFGVQFYIKVKKFNKIENLLKKSITEEILNIQSSQNKKLQNSIQVQLSDDTLLQADCAVLFANNYQGKSYFQEGIRKGKHSDIDFTKANRIIVDPNCRSDSKRVFAAGDCASTQFFFTKTRLQTNNPLVAYQQGLYGAFNIMALNVPYHYIPFERRTFHSKTLLYAGQSNYEFSNMYIDGSVQIWDFVCVYAKQQDILAVSATPSRQRDFNILRESFRLQCQPVFSDIVTGKWEIPNLQKLIRKLNKSGCYRDPIRTLEERQNIGDIIWVQRNTSGFENDHPLSQDYSDVEVDERGYVREL